MSLDPGERIGLIKAIGAELGLQAWDDIDLTLSEFGLPTTDQWGGPGDGSGYVRDMLRGAPDVALLRLHDYLGAGVIDRPVSTEAQRRIWGDGFRLFVSHTAAHKDFVYSLREHLSYLGVSTFIAHKDIEPTREWEDEILNALNSAGALAAFMHDDFHKSKWTDQEVGFALGRGLLVMPVVCEKLLPYGFLGKVQGVIVTDNKDAQKLSVEILDALVNNEATRQKLAPHLIAQFERSRSPAHGLSFLQRIARADLSDEMLKRLDEGDATNQHLKDSTVRVALDQILTSNNYKRPVSTYDAYGEEPF